MQNEPAFPNVCDEAHGMNCFPGMSLRDYFAAAALQGALAAGGGENYDPINTSAAGRVM